LTIWRLISSIAVTDLDTLARTAYGEARSEGSGGIHAVINVIMNRVAKAQAYVATHNGKSHPLYGDGVAATACLANYKGIYQFSCWSKDKFNAKNLHAISKVTLEEQVFATCYHLARDALNDDLPDVTVHSTHYKVIGTPAKWAQGLIPAVVIGAHEFFNNVP